MSVTSVFMPAWAMSFLIGFVQTREIYEFLSMIDIEEAEYLEKFLDFADYNR